MNLLLRVRKLGESVTLRLWEWGAAGILLTWGMVISQDASGFGETSYIELGRIFSQEHWTQISVGLALARILVLTINGSWRRCSHTRAGLAFLSCFVWFEVSIGFLLSGRVTTGIAVYPWFLVMDTVTVFRALRDARRVDDARARERTTDVCSA